MEGWLYLIRSSRLGLQYSRKRYFILRGNSLDCYKFVPRSKTEDPVRSALIDSCVRVAENGRETMLGNVFYTFTLYNSSNQTDQLKLGARSSEEAAWWVRSLMDTAPKDCPHNRENVMACSGRRVQPLRLSRAKERSRMHSVDWTIFSSVHTDPMASDVIAPSPWTIIGCTNGLRLFKEAKEGDIHGKNWDNQPSLMAVGVVEATSETIFQTLMSLGPSRSEWDFCLSHGRVVEHLDGHTDIIHKKLRGDWLPRGMKKRDLLLQRYWRREDDGTYVIAYHSVYHYSCQPERGYTRACLKSGGYVISPVNQGRQSVIKHMLAIDWKSWTSYLLASSAEFFTIRMIVRVAALRELFRAKLGNCDCSNHLSGQMTREIGLPQSEKEGIKVEVQLGCDDNNLDSVEMLQNHSVRPTNMDGLLLQLSDAADEFFDFLDESEYDQSEAVWPSKEATQSQLVQDQHNPRLSAAVDFVRRFQDLAVQRRGYIELQEASIEDVVQCIYGTTLPNDPSCTMSCSWTSADPSTFLIRGESYLQDHQKIKVNSTLMQMVAADWLNSDRREDDLGGRPGGIVQKYAIQDASKFFFIINLQIPGSTRYNLALYYMMDTPLENVPLLESFVKGDDMYRNSRFKLIPYISKGSWIVKQSVGKKAGLVGQALEINYCRGSNYLELDIDVGSSSVAKSVVSLVLSYLSNLVIEMAFLIQGNTQEELPEFLLGTCRLNHLDASKSFPLN